ncbi:MAG TPA: Gfo/Idh/MocA family oxidoreductase [Candidatus Hydrogenedentes bacterium]|nr:Gfo/Idh/MocA family oxidoreductase [Candidatus Hydrogenedentota bacterium]HPC18023.1 Gfo/Idh/MocA family oxidoreductase [Candidatus Hydrogenedentota bacterium]HRT21970.1 Gfo/Idh/MocA family oxidoreductase [Candidatus Hydrogenedentota bacterium]HRT66672.1 Gfo/Idh/MocA family oxidoreductase [Candidatus Hydrogenedentota bacterium]
MNEKKTFSRRDFLKGACAAMAGPYVVPSSAFGANEKLTVGTVGMGPQGRAVMEMFMASPDARVVAVCDVNALRREEARRRVEEAGGRKGCAAYNDFRELIARPDLDIIHCATPDHWHVPIALEAARAGKDMYVEKPLGLAVEHDKALRDAIHARGNVFQFGTQHRSEANFRFACELVRNGRIGRLHTIRVALDASKRSPNFPPMPVPEWLDYDLWLGPAPLAPYTENRIVNRYWWHISDYTLGFVAGQNIHFADIAQWGNGTEHTGPVEIEGWGVFPEEGLTDCAIAYNTRHTFSNGVVMHLTDDVENPMGVRFEGDKGWVFVSLGLIDAEPKSLLRTVFDPGEPRLYKSINHVQNFLDCVRSRRETICPIDQAVRSDTICHLADIAMRLKRRLRWDPAKERFIADDEANRMLSRAMRAPWHL